jgi:hypothetical protein
MNEHLQRARAVQCGGAPEGANMNIHAMSAGRHVENAALAVLNAQRWKQDRADFRPTDGTRGAWLEASWWRPAGHSALQMRWTRRLSLNCEGQSRSD